MGELQRIRKHMARDSEPGLADDRFAQPSEHRKHMGWLGLERKSERHLWGKSAEDLEFLKTPSLTRTDTFFIATDI